MMASSWCLHERTKLGGEGAVWDLFREDELRVGRASDSHIKFHSQSVDDKHAVFKWEHRSAAFTVKDLGSVNGTYVNNRPLRGTSVVLKHNDSIRFGYDKERVFRIEECFSSSVLAKGSTQDKTSVSLSSSPQPPTTHAPSTNTPSAPSTNTPSAPSTNAPSTSKTTTPTTPSSSSSDHAPLSVSLRVESEQPDRRHSAPSIQHALPIGPEGDEDSLGSPQRCDGRRSVEHSPARNKGSKLYGVPNWWGEGLGAGQESMAAARQREFEYAKNPGSQILRDLDPVDTRKDAVPKLSTKDELRMQSIANSDPGASWVIDFGGGGSTLPRVKRARSHSSRPRSADPSPNRLSTRRDASPVPKRAVTPTSLRSTSFSTHTSSQATPTGSRRGRAATPPPVVSTSRKLPHGGESPKRKPTKRPNPLVSTGQSVTSHHSNPPSPQRSKPPSPQRSKPPSPQRSKPPTPKLSKAPQGRSPHSKSKSETTKSGKVHSPPAERNSPPRGRTISPPNAVITPPDLPHISTEDSIELKHLNEGGKMSHLVRDEETYTAHPVSSDECHSLSSLSDHTLSPPTDRPAVVVTSSGGVASVERGVEEEEGEGEATARKQWANEESPDSLMIANIEARMRRLSRMAHQTARQVTTLKNRLQDGCQLEVRGVDYLSLRDTSPVVTRAEQHLPEWRSYNKEAHSIFRNMRVVEKWLQDIEGTLGSIQPAGGSGNEGMASNKEGVVSNDYVDLASDGELYLDTVESNSNSELSD